MTQPISLPGQLGWAPAPPDPRTLRLERYVATGLPGTPTVPDSCDWMRKVQHWPVDDNDRISDCVFAACAHLDQAWTAYAGTEYVVPLEQVVGAYSAVTGYDPRQDSATGENPTDNGTRALDALNYWRGTGIAGRKILAYAQVDVRDHRAVKAAIYLFGGIFIAAAMPRAAAAQFEQGKTWTPAAGPNGLRGSWGGHAMHCGVYGARGLTVTTWGRPQRLSWHWWDAYVAEAFAVVSPDWLNRTSGQSPSGIDLHALLADLRSITTTT